MIRISRWKRRLGASLVAGILTLVSVVSVSAQTLNIMDEVTETTSDYAEDISYNILKGAHLNYGSTKIQRLSSNEVAIYGLTQCHHICDEVYLYIYLERKVNGSYATYKYWKFEANNATSLSKGINVIVPSGTYYRVRGYHAAKDGSKESTSTLTSGILVK